MGLSEQHNMSTDSALSGTSPAANLWLKNDHAVDPSIEKYQRHLTRKNVLHVKPPRILVADDDPMVRLIAKESLENCGFSVVQAANGKEAIDRFLSEQADLVLCDVMMPVADGFEFCESIRDTNIGRHTPIVMLTGLDDTESIEKAFSCGATEFCVKPINWALLPYKINYILRASLVLNELQVSEERYTLASQGANDGLWDWDVSEEKIYYSPRWKSMLGFSQDEVGVSPDEWWNRIHPDDKDRFESDLYNHMSGGTSHFINEHRLKNKHGDYIWMMSRGVCVLDNCGNPCRMAGSQTDISQQKEAEEKLVFGAYHDVLTQLPNRALFLDRLSHCIDLSSRRPDFFFAVIFMDLDRFKIVNDSLGHILGDCLLIEVGKRIQSVLQTGDTLARLGGDEFVILCEEAGDMASVTRLANKIQKQLMQPINLEGQHLVISSSMGITSSDKMYTRPEDMLRDADTAMYRAKGNKGSHYEIFDPTMHEHVLSVMQLESDLRVALELNEFRVHYQPIVDLRTDGISGFEALMRWEHPQKGLLQPDDFLKVAVETRLIVQMGRWLLETACKQLKEWQCKWSAAKDWTVSVNISSPELAQTDLADVVSGILSKCELQPGSLKLEVTETSLIENSKNSLHTMNELNKLGVMLSIDDFGTGYSSFSYLVEYPFSELKIDRSFIRQIEADTKKQQTVNTIVSLAHNLGLSVIAEGSETALAYRQLKESSIEYAQGFSINEPQEADDIVKYLTGRGIS